MKLRLFSFSFFLTAIGFGQNLIPNPGFEEVLTETEYQWVQPQGPYYHYEKTDSTYLHQAHSGDYVNGLCMYNNRENEFLHIKLLRPLEEGKVYKISTQARLMRAKCFNASIQKLIGVHLGKKSLDTHIPGDLYLKPQLNWELPDSNRFEWFELSGSYKAKGGEEFLTLGYFAATQTEEIRRREEDFAKCKTFMTEEQKQEDKSWLYLPPDEQKKYIKEQKKQAKKKKSKTNQEVLQSFEKPDSEWEQLPETGYDPSSAYFQVRYYFDDFCLAEMDEEMISDCSPEEVPITLEKGKSIILRNVFFDSDQSELRSESFTQLDVLKKVMYENPQMVIEIHGFTDNQGEEDHNFELSTARAKSVENWLIQEGIEPTRINSKGYGESNPIASNGDEAGRALNRRVELLVVDM